MSRTLRPGPAPILKAAPAAWDSDAPRGGNRLFTDAAFDLPAPTCKCGRKSVLHRCTGCTLSLCASCFSAHDCPNRTERR